MTIASLNSVLIGVIPPSGAGQIETTSGNNCLLQHFSVNPQHNTRHFLLKLLYTISSKISK